MSTRELAVSAVRRRAIVVQAFGEHRCIPIAKEDVIAYLIVTDWPYDRKEALYRQWCAVVGVDVWRSDLRRIKQRSRRLLNRKLF